MKYYVVKQTSKTGARLMELTPKIKEAVKEQNKVAAEIGAEMITQPPWAAYGGVASVEFKDKHSVDRTQWREIEENSFIPIKRYELPIVSNAEVNACIGYMNATGAIGVNWSNTEYVGLVVPDFIPVTIDCKEVTLKKYKKAFGL